MSKYISIFFLTLLVSVICFFIFSNVFDGGDYAETAIYTFSAIIIILLSFSVSLM
ncbi:hypothetical protein [Psychrobacillus psychrodurans]|uniref:hypothetical protein n=1 Tax=Psychrobacillus psychrodurans TaxID=126157 RepID=UPI003D0734B5